MSLPRSGVINYEFIFPHSPNESIYVGHHPARALSAHGASNPLQLFILLFFRITVVRHHRSVRTRLGASGSCAEGHHRRRGEQPGDDDPATSGRPTGFVCSVIMRGLPRVFGVMLLQLLVSHDPYPPSSHCYKGMGSKSKATIIFRNPFRP